MFCLEHFYLKCIIKDTELIVNDPLKGSGFFEVPGFKCQQIEDVKDIGKQNK